MCDPDMSVVQGKVHHHMRAGTSTAPPLVAHVVRQPSQQIWEA